MEFWEPDRFTLDRLLNRHDTEREIRSRTTLTSSVNAPGNRHSEFKPRDLDLQESPFAIHDVPYAVEKIVQCAVRSSTVVRLREI